MLLTIVCSLLVRARLHAMSKRMPALGRTARLSDAVSWAVDRIVCVLLPTNVCSIPVLYLLHKGKCMAGAYEYMEICAHNYLYTCWIPVQHYAQHFQLGFFSSKNIFGTVLAQAHMPGARTFPDSYCPYLGLHLCVPTRQAPTHAK